MNSTFCSSFLCFSTRFDPIQCKQFDEKIRKCETPLKLLLRWNIPPSLPPPSHTALPGTTLHDPHTILVNCAVPQGLQNDSTFLSMSPYIYIQQGTYLDEVAQSSIKPKPIVSAEDKRNSEGKGLSG